MVTPKPPTPANSTMLNMHESDSDTKSSNSSDCEHVSVETPIKFTDPCQQVCQSTDPSKWFPINNATISFWLQQGSDSCRNENVANNYPASLRHYNPTTREPKGRTRCFNSRHFYCSAPKGQSLLNLFKDYKLSAQMLTN